jgi:hypothetical protein
MKAKNLIAMAVASTFGWSAAAFAGAGPAVITPTESNESAPALSYEESFGSGERMAAIGSSMDEAGGTVSGSSDESFAAHSAAMSGEGLDDESYAFAEDGFYNGYYLVSWTPVTAESWDYYVIDRSESPEQRASAEEVYFLTPGYDLVWVPTMLDISSFPSGSEEEASG